MRDEQRPTQQNTSTVLVILNPEPAAPQLMQCGDVALEIGDGNLPTEEVRKLTRLNVVQQFG